MFHILNSSNNYINRNGLQLIKAKLSMLTFENGSSSATKHRKNKLNINFFVFSKIIFTFKH